jgi:hypothetical protein
MKILEERLDMEHERNGRLFNHNQKLNDLLEKHYDEVEIGNGI